MLSRLAFLFVSSRVGFKLVIVTMIAGAATLRRILRPKDVREGLSSVQVGSGVGGATTISGLVYQVTPTVRIGIHF